jgi:serine/threonine-protein kinase
MKNPTNTPAGGCEITLTLLDTSQSKGMHQWAFRGQPVVTLGRSADNDVVLNDQYVSRRHIEFRFESGQWTLINRGTNGTFVEGERVNQAKLKDGATLRIADYGPTLRFEAKAGLTGSDHATVGFVKNSVLDSLVEIDERKKEIQVADIAASQFFKDLQEKAKNLRKRPKSGDTR